MRLLCTFVPNAEVWAGSRISGRAHSGSVLALVVRTAPHHPSQKADHLRTALRESDIPILIVVHDWALLLTPSKRKRLYLI
mgnify:CR=1 FL=1